MIHVSAARKTIGAPARPDLRNLFPEAPVVTFAGNPTIVLPHDFKVTKVLRNLGLEVPAPILHQYSWPHPPGKPPFAVQKHTAALLTTNQRGYVLNGMGCGKTASALWAYDYIRQSGVASRMLVVAPLSTLNFTWAREVFSVLPHLSCSVLHGTKAKRLKKLAEEADVYVVNFDGLSIIEDALKERPDIDVLCLDELATFRNGSAARSKAAARVASRMTWVWGMTGSPTPNSPCDAWGQARIVTPNTVPRFFGRFRDELMQKVSQFKYVPKKGAAERVLAALQPAVRFSLDDVLELPEVVERAQDIELGKKQAEVYDKLRQHAYALVNAKEITAVNAGAVLNKLLQISLGYVYTQGRGVVALDNDLRLDALVDVVNSCDRKLIVWVPFTHALEGVNARLNAEGIETAVVNGATSRADREQIFSLFQNTDRIKVLAAHPATASHGLTLTAANTIVWFGPTTSLETFEQANARIRRIGQKHRQQIIMFQSTAAEKRMYARLRMKQKVQDNILDLFAENS